VIGDIGTRNDRIDHLKVELSELKEAHSLLREGKREEEIKKKKLEREVIDLRK